MDSRTKNATRNIVFGLLNKIINIILPFCTRTLLIYKLGKQYLGLNSLFTSILQVLNLSELGIGSALIYSMYRPIADDDTEKICNYLNFYKKCYKIIGIIVLLIGIVILPFLKYLIKGNIPSEINLYVIYIIYLVNSVISYLFFSYRQSLLIASQRNDIISKMNCLIIILQNIFQILLLILFNNYYLYIIVLPISTLFNNFLIYFVTKKYYPQYEAHGIIDKMELHNVKKNIGGMFFQKIGNIILTNVDNIVISACLGIEILGIYNNYYYIIASLTMFLSIFLESIKPGVGNFMVKESVQKNYLNFKIFNFIYNWIVSWFTIGFLCLVQNFIYVWIGKEYLLDSSFAIVFSIYLFIHHWCDMLYVYQEAKGLWWNNRYVQLFGSAVNLVLNLILVNIIGLYGILISTIISVVLVLDVGYFKVLFKNYFKKSSWGKEYLFSQFKYLFATVVAGTLTFVICSYMKSSNLMLLVKLIIVTFLPNLILLLFYFKSDEFMESKKFILKHYLKK